MKMAELFSLKVYPFILILHMMWSVIKILIFRVLPHSISAVQMPEPKLKFYGEIRKTIMLKYLFLLSPLKD